MASRMKADLPPGGVMRVKPNQGWLSMDPSQQRAHEAFASLPSQKTKAQQAADSQNPPTPPVDKKGKGKAVPQPAMQAPISQTKPVTPPPAQPAEPRRAGLRARPDRPATPPKAPKSNAKSNAKAGISKPSDPNKYLFPAPKTLPQCKPGTLGADVKIGENGRLTGSGKDGARSKTPGISLPTNSEQRVPPRPQNREQYNLHGVQKPPPPPAPKPSGAKEAPARLASQIKLPGNQRIQRVHPWDMPKGPADGRPKPPPPGGAGGAAGGNAGASKGRKNTESLPIRPVAPPGKQGHSPSSSGGKTVAGSLQKPAWMAGPGLQSKTSSPAAKVAPKSPLSKSPPPKMAPKSPPPKSPALKAAPKSPLPNNYPPKTSLPKPASPKPAPAAPAVKKPVMPATTTTRSSSELAGKKGKRALLKHLELYRRERIVALDEALQCMRMRRALMNSRARWVSDRGRM
jgi:hypothetical protein